MTLRIAIASLALGAVAVLAACSINHRSGDYACTTTSDCSGGRTCDVDGFCVTGPGGDDATNPGSGSNHLDAGVDGNTPIDAGPTADAAVCPDQCSSCDFGSMACDIDCSVPGPNGASRCGNGTGTPTTVQCPTGFNCTMECTTPGSCRSVSCIGGVSCQIQCASANSCRTVACGKGACDVECTGQSSCKNVACAESCKCDVNCQGEQTCTGSILCNGDPNTCDNFLQPGCDSTNDPSCDMCNQ